MTTLSKLPPPPPDVLKSIQYAEPPRRVPRGYFDELVKPTGELLRKQWNLGQVADFYIGKNVIAPERRASFVWAMRQRFSRTRRKAMSAAKLAETTHEWRESAAFASIHIVPKGQLLAICGSQDSRWRKPDFFGNKCARCVGIARKNGIVALED